MGDVVPEQDFVTPPTDPQPNSQAKPHGIHLEPKRIAPAASIQSGLLLEPPLDLSGFTREQFVALMETVGYMPPDQTLTAEEISELKAWLDDKE
ncbi:MAG: hypothetical protein Q8M16_06890 [Pirellulaceae bacterium]|nr:hypothetical protein [Pirellulaceae bacterium]